MTAPELLWRWSDDFIRAGLHGTSETDLLTLLGTRLTAAGFDLALVEIACDTVDPERSNRFFLWQPDMPGCEGESVAVRLFEHLMRHRLPMLRCKPGEFPIVDQALAGRAPAARVTEYIAFAHHIEPDATLGLFDDVVSFFATTRPGGFMDREIALMEAILPHFALVFGARLNAGNARNLLATYLGRDAAQALLRGRSRLGDVGRIRAIVLYCDLLGFTGLTERLSPEELIATLNLFFETVTMPAARAGAQVSGHVGDAVVLFFPVANPVDEGAVCAAALEAAQQALDAVEALNVQRPANAAPLRARIGIDIGEVVHGNIGSTGRFSFTIIGTAVNRAARLQALAKEFGVSLLMTEDVADRANIPRRSFGCHTLRGSERAVEIVGTN